VEPDPRVLASSFGAAAGAYAEHRPDYAVAAVRWALAPAKLPPAKPAPVKAAPAKPAPAPRVLDLGAGTGKLTGTLLALGADVVAVEPDPAMLAELRRALPSVRALTGRAEAIPLPDASVDAVLVGNALHWFDLELAGPEIARVLAPGGLLAGLWNVMDDRIGWVGGLAAVSGSAAIGPRDTFSRWRAATAGLLGGGAAEQAEFAHRQRRTADSLVATLATRAGILVLPEPEREAALGRIRAYLAGTPETAGGEFTLPMLTGVLRVRFRLPTRGTTSTTVQRGR
jgi:SAM-dependent methyltransferase